MILLNWVDVWQTSISWQWTFTSSNFMNLPNQFHKSFCTLWFSYSQLLNFLPPSLHSLPSCCTLVPFYSVFTWKPLVSISLVSSLVFEYCTSKQATQTQCSWSAQSCGFESVVVDLIVGRVLVTVNRAQIRFGVQCLVLRLDKRGQSKFW